jgi:hypothetical protein
MEIVKGTQFFLLSVSECILIVLEGIATTSKVVVSAPNCSGSEAGILIRQNDAP